MNKHSMIVAALLCILSACADNSSDTPPTPAPDPALSDLRPVDMLYHATVVQGETDCDDPKDPAESTAEVNAFLMSDGSLTIGFNGKFVPGPLSYEKVVRKGSRVDVTKEETDNIKFVHHVTGVLDPDHVDLIVKGQFHNWDTATGKDRACTKTATLKGKARPLLDPNALDGHYKISIAETYACPGKADEDLGLSMAALDINDDPARPRISMDLGGVLFAFARTDAAKQGTVAEQAMYSVPDQGPDMRLGTVAGTMRPDAIDLVITYKPENSSDPCADVLVVKGAKTIPSLSSIENRYRVKYSQTYDCVDVSFAGDPPIENEGTAEVMSVPDGILLNEFGMTTLLTMKGDSFNADIPFADGSSMTYKGTLKPGEFFYHVTAKDVEGPHACKAEVDAVARPRFIFP